MNKKLTEELLKHLKFALDVILMGGYDEQTRGTVLNIIGKSIGHITALESRCAKLEEALEYFKVGDYCADATCDCLSTPREIASSALSDTQDKKEG
jgi:hypothetical protein